MQQKELENKILEAQKAYYDGREIMSDAEFDKLWDQLERDFPDSSLLQRVGEDTVKGEKIKHLMRMGSQAKFNTEEGFYKWLDSEKIEFPIIVSDKIDGNSLELQYKDGRLHVAVTRGNSYYGENATRAALGIPSIPKELPEAFTGAVRGEVVMNKSIFEDKYSSDFANPRNLTAGLIKNEDFNHYEDLRFIAYDTNKPFRAELDKWAWLKEQGFDAVRIKTVFNAKDLLAYRATRSPRDSEYAIDGLVLKQNAIDPKDAEELKPRKAHAFKWKDEEEISVLRSIEWSMTGASLTPVAIFDPVELEGTTVKRASLANPSLIKEMELKLGDRIVVVKRGQIIPKIERVEEHCGTQDIEIPTVCPKCGGPLTLRESGTKLFCDNENCSSHFAAQLGKYLGILDVKGFGTEMQKALIDFGADDLWDLYDEDFRKRFNDFYGSINSIKAFNDLDKKSKGITFAQYIAAFNMGNIGLEMAQTLVDAGYNNMETLGDITSEKLITIPGWSTIRAEKFITAFDKFYDRMCDLLEKNWVTIAENKPVEVANTGISGLHICVTGKLEHFSRKEIEAFLKENGAIADSGVNAKTNILVTNDQTSGSSKLQNAAKFGTKIINEEQLIALVKN